MTVQVIEYSTGKVIKEIVVSSERKADKVESGLNINLNHEKYYTRTVKG